MGVTDAKVLVMLIAIAEHRGGDVGKGPTAKHLGVEIVVIVRVITITATQ